MWNPWFEPQHCIKPSMVTPAYNTTLGKQRQGYHSPWSVYQTQGLRWLHETQSQTKLATGASECPSLSKGEARSGKHLGGLHLSFPPSVQVPGSRARVFKHRPVLCWKFFLPIRILNLTSGGSEHCFLRMEEGLNRTWVTVLQQCLLFQNLSPVILTQRLQAAGFRPPIYWVPLYCTILLNCLPWSLGTFLMIVGFILQFANDNPESLLAHRYLSLQ